MSSISSVSSYSSSVVSGMSSRARPDPAKMVEDLFAQIDTKGQGYIEKSDLQSAFAQISESSGTASSVSIDDVFGQLDGDGDGKVTQDEMTTSLKKLADELDSQFDQMRMAGGMGGPGGPGGTPPAPQQDDTGFSKEALESQLTEIGSSDSKRSTLISNIVNNFDEADTDSDGKVSFKEAMAYDQKSQSSTASSTATTSSSSSTTSSGSTSSSNNDLAVMKRIMDLMHAYASSESGQNSLLSALSVSA